MPGFDLFQHLGRYAKGGVDLTVLRFGDCGFADLEDSSVLIFGQNNRDDLMSAELLANGPTMRCELRPARTGAR